jgi:GTP-binding protein
VLEDVPGLIPRASEGKGLGIEFLKHIERTGVLLHLLDLYRLDNIFLDYEDIRKELELFSPELIQKQEVIVFSKADLLDNEMKEHIL